ncbi:MAG: hypothetical protein GOU98_04570 [Candidatus Altiarchaeota archaeon]|nr:hypothetical protein [Candidatus Altiarchaeota archaeon]
MGKNKDAIYTISYGTPSDDKMKEITSIQQGNSYTITTKEANIYVLNKTGQVGEIKTNDCNFPTGVISVFAKKNRVDLAGSWFGEGVKKKRKNTEIPVNGFSVQVNNGTYHLVLEQK